MEGFFATPVTPEGSPTRIGMPGDNVSGVPGPIQLAGSAAGVRARGDNVVGAGTTNVGKKNAGRKNAGKKNAGKSVPASSAGPSSL